MNCLKCGRETESEHVFCTACLEVMGAYPVKPGTPVQLPKRAIVPEQPKKKLHRRRNLPPEEQVTHLRGAVRWLLATVALLAVALSIVAAMLIYELSQPHLPQPGGLGRNYTAAPQDAP